MVDTFRYGEDNMASFPDNSSGLITAQAMREQVISNRSGGVQIIEQTPFTVPIVIDVPVNVNPLLPNPEVSGVLWTADGNNRAFANYQAAIPTATVPTGYSKYAQILFTFAGEKTGGGTDAYLFQIDVDGTPVGDGISAVLTTNPGFVTLVANVVVDISDAPPVGLTVTGVGTGDDIDITAFEMMVFDFQLWTGP